MMFRVVLMTALLIGSVAGAQTSMSAAEFEEYTTGKTLTFSANGRAYGFEEYREGRRVRWSFLDGRCEEGIWYPQGGMICFQYENIADPQCWSFFRQGAGLMARFENRPEGTVLFETRQSEAPMQCLGPEIGV